MAHQKGQKKQDAEKKDLTHSVAIVTNRNLKEIYNKKVAIVEVSNGIAKVQELESDVSCYYCVPIRWLKVLSDKESIEAYKENCGRMLDELFDGSGDLVKRMFEQIVEDKIEYDKDGNIINAKGDSKEGDKELAEKYFAEGMKLLAKHKTCDKGKPSNAECHTAGNDEDSERNFIEHHVEGGNLMIQCSQFCRNYKVSPIYFISQLSEHLYAMHERYAPKVKE